MDGWVDEWMSGCLSVCLFVCLSVCLCVYHLNRCKTSIFCRGQQPIFLCCPTKLRKMWWMGSWTHEPVPALYIYIVPPLGAYKSQLGGHIFYHCCFIRSTSTVIIYSIYIYIFIYIYISNLIVLVVVGVLHVRCIPQQNSQRQFSASVY